MTRPLIALAFITLLLAARRPAVARTDDSRTPDAPACLWPKHDQRHCPQWPCVAY